LLTKLRDRHVLSLGRRTAPEQPTAARSCRQCGRQPTRPDAAVCGRCGIPFGSAPRADVTLPTCHICYATVADDGLLPSLARAGHHVPIAEHIAEHDQHPVGDDEWLETLRSGDRIRIGRWEAPFDVVRRYLVTGVVDAGRRRAMLHDAIVSAMGQIARWGDDASSVVGDQAEWREARAAVSALLERYHRR
jgi:ribosomal protein L37E